MFDIGFWEISVIAVVALLVVGPKEFPTLLRTVASWVRSMRSFVSDFRQELDREVSKAEELKRLAERETEIAKLHKVLDETKQGFSIEPPGKGGSSSKPARGDDKGGAQAPARAPGRGAEDEQASDPSGRDTSG